MSELARCSAFGTPESGSHVRTVCRRGLIVSERLPLAILRVQRLPAMDLPGGAGLAAWELAPNTACGGEPLVLWTSPVERLIVTQSQPAEALLAALAAEPHAAATVATDVSHALVALRVQGRGAIAALAADVTVDLEGAEMAPGRCAQTLFAQLPVLLHRPEHAETFDLYVDRSVARFTWDWLVRCGGGEAPP